MSETPPDGVPYRDGRATPNSSELFVAELDRVKLDQLFADLGSLATDVDVSAKYRDTQRLNPVSALTLPQAHSLLVGRRVVGVQVRYGYAGQRFVDTLLPTRSGVRLIRSFDTPAASERSA